MKKSTPKLLKIGQISQQSGLPASTLRYYEAIGLIPSPIRISGQRHYHPDILPRLSIIQWAKSVGFSLEEILQFTGQLSPTSPLSQQMKPLASEKMAALDAEIEHLIAMKSVLQKSMSCECTSLQTCELIA